MTIAESTRAFEKMTKAFNKMSKKFDTVSILLEKESLLHQPQETLQLVSGGMPLTAYAPPQIIEATAAPRVENPPELDIVLEEMMVSGKLNPPDMKKIISAIRPMMEKLAEYEKEKA